jgi:putative oxidoreductase
MSPYWKRIIGSQWLLLLARVYLGLLFIIASWHKIIDPETFALDVATYQLLPLWAINGFALVLPWVELLAGAMLILGLRARAAALLVLFMMLSFIVALLWALHLGLDMSCGCFASQAATTDDPISSHTLLRDLFWFSLALYVVTFEKASLGFDRIFSTGRLRGS